MADTFADKLAALSSRIEQDTGVKGFTENIQRQEADRWSVVDSISKYANNAWRSVVENTPLSLESDILYGEGEGGSGGIDDAAARGVARLLKSLKLANDSAIRGTALDPGRDLLDPTKRNPLGEFSDRQSEGIYNWLSEVERRNQPNAEEQKLYSRAQEISEEEGDGFVAGVRTTGRAIGEAATNPELWPGLIALSIESLPESAALMAGGAAGAMVKGGMLAKTLAGFGGAFSAGYPLSYGRNMEEFLREEGVDTTSYEGLKRAYSDPELMERAKARTAAASGGETFWNAMSISVAGRLFDPVKSRVSGTRTRIDPRTGREVTEISGNIPTSQAARTAKEVGGTAAGVAAEIGTQSGLGAAAEISRQLGGYGEVRDVADVALEALVEIPMGAVEAATMRGTRGTVDPRFEDARRVNPGSGAAPAGGPRAAALPATGEDGPEEAMPALAGPDAPAAALPAPPAPAAPQAPAAIQEALPALPEGEVGLAQPDAVNPELEAQRQSLLADRAQFEEQAQAGNKTARQRIQAIDREIARLEQASVPQVVQNTTPAVAPASGEFTPLANQGSSISQEEPLPTEFNDTRNQAIRRNLPTLPSGARDVFESGLARFLREGKPQTMPAKQWAAFIGNSQAVKKAETEYTGIIDKLKEEGSLPMSNIQVAEMAERLMPRVTLSDKLPYNQAVPNRAESYIGRMLLNTNFAAFNSSGDLNPYMETHESLGDYANRVGIARTSPSTKILMFNNEPSRGGNVPIYSPQFPTPNEYDAGLDLESKSLAEKILAVTPATREYGGSVSIERDSGKNLLWQMLMTRSKKYQPRLPSPQGPIYTDIPDNLTANDLDVDAAQSLDSAAAIYNGQLLPLSFGEQFHDFAARQATQYIKDMEAFGPFRFVPIGSPIVESLKPTEYSQGKGSFTISPREKRFLVHVPVGIEFTENIDAQDDFGGEIRAWTTFLVDAAPDSVSTVNRISKNQSIKELKSAYAASPGSRIQDQSTFDSWLSEGNAPGAGRLIAAVNNAISSEGAKVSLIKTNFIEPSESANEFSYARFGNSFSQDVLKEIPSGYDNTKPIIARGLFSDSGGVTKNKKPKYADYATLSPSKVIPYAEYSVGFRPVDYSETVVNFNDGPEYYENDHFKNDRGNLVHVRYSLGQWLNPETNKTEKVMAVEEIQSDIHGQAEKGKPYFFENKLDMSKFFDIDSLLEDSYVKSSIEGGDRVLIAEADILNSADPKADGWSDDDVLRAAEFVLDFFVRTSDSLKNAIQEHFDGTGTVKNPANSVGQFYGFGTPAGLHVKASNPSVAVAEGINTPLLRRVKKSNDFDIATEIGQHGYFDFDADKVRKDWQLPLVPFFSRYDTASSFGVVKVAKELLAYYGKFPSPFTQFANDQINVFLENTFLVVEESGSTHFAGNIYTMPILNAERTNSEGRVSGMYNSKDLIKNPESVKMALKDASEIRNEILQIKEKQSTSGQYMVKELFHPSLKYQSELEGILAGIPPGTNEIYSPSILDAGEMDYRPNFPFKKTEEYSELGLKALFARAAELGVDRVAGVNTLALNLLYDRVGDNSIIQSAKIWIDPQRSSTDADGYTYFSFQKYPKKALNPQRAANRGNNFATDMTLESILLYNELYLNGTREEIVDSLSNGATDQTSAFINGKWVRGPATYGKTSSSGLPKLAGSGKKELIEKIADAIIATRNPPTNNQAFDIEIDGIVYEPTSKSEGFEVAYGKIFNGLLKKYGTKHGGKFETIDLSNSGVMPDLVLVDKMNINFSTGEVITKIDSGLPTDGPASKTEVVLRFERAGSLVNNFLFSYPDQEAYFFAISKGATPDKVARGEYRADVVPLVVPLDFNNGAAVPASESVESREMEIRQAEAKYIADAQEAVREVSRGPVAKVMTVPSIEITPKLRTFLSGRQPLFMKGTVAEPAGIDAAQNDQISNLPLIPGPRKLANKIASGVRNTPSSSSRSLSLRLSESNGQVRDLGNGYVAYKEPNGSWSRVQLQPIRDTNEAEAFSIILDAAGLAFGDQKSSPLSSLGGVMIVPESIGEEDTLGMFSTSGISDDAVTVLSLNRRLVNAVMNTTGQERSDALAMAAIAVIHEATHHADRKLAISMNNMPRSQRVLRNEARARKISDSIGLTNEDAIDFLFDMDRTDRVAYPELLANPDAFETEMMPDGERARVIGYDPAMLGKVFKEIFVEINKLSGKEPSQDLDASFFMYPIASFIDMTAKGNVPVAESLNFLNAEMLAQLGAMYHADSQALLKISPAGYKLIKEFYDDFRQLQEAGDAVSTGTERPVQAVPREVRQADAGQSVEDGVDDAGTGQGGGTEGTRVRQTDDGRVGLQGPEGAVLARNQEARVRRPVPESLDAISSLDGASKLATSRPFKSNREFKMALQDAVRREARAAGIDISNTDDPRVSDYLVRVAVADARRSIKTNANAIGWYGRKVDAALNILSNEKMHPELASDENARFAYIFALAVTSNGLEVNPNFRLADKAYVHWKTNGRMPTNIGIGTAAQSINEHFELFNNMVEKLGIEFFRKMMLTEFTSGQLNRMGFPATGENADVVVRGAAILGPKIGNGFFSNLYKNFDQLTMDRWLTRSWGRWTGTLVQVNTRLLPQQGLALESAIEAVRKNKAEFAKLESLIGIKIRPIPTKSNALRNRWRQRVAAAIQKASIDKDVRGEINAVSGGSDVRKAGNNYHKNLDGQKESPSNGTERIKIRGVMGRALEELRKSYAMLKMADFQAVLWYPEKRLYDTSKSAQDAELDAYENDEAPDYANAAAELAREYGVPEAEIRYELDRSNQAPSSTVGTGGVQPRADEDADGRATQRTEGLVGGERSNFIAKSILAKLRSDRSRNGTASGPYETKGGGNGKGVRLLGIESGVLSRHSPSRVFANDLAYMDQAKPKFLELDPANGGNILFHKAITEFQKIGKSASSVYAYPVKDYETMRLFLSESGNTGVAIKPDGDIVSVFSSERGGRSAMEIAIQMGGRKLDAFDTILPEFYKSHGFSEIARLKWDEGQAPAGWDKKHYQEFNNGEPDVVFMVYDPDSVIKQNIAAIAPSYTDAVRQQDAFVQTSSAPVTTATPSVVQSTTATEAPQAAPNEEGDSNVIDAPDRISQLIINTNYGSDFVRGLYSQDPINDVLTEFPDDIETVTYEEILRAREYIKKISQDKLREKYGDEITVYRGLRGTEDVFPVLSYTLRKSTARFFAEQQGIRSGQIEELKIPVSEVLSYSKAIQGDLRAGFDEEEILIKNKSAGEFNETRNQGMRGGRRISTPPPKTRLSLANQVKEMVKEARFTQVELDQINNGETFVDRFIRRMQDDFVRVKRFEEAAARSAGVGLLPHWLSPYRAEERMHGQIKNGFDMIEKETIEPLSKFMRDKDITVDELGLYLMAKHAKERNAYIATINPAMPDGGSGLTNQEAKDILDLVQSQQETGIFDQAAQFIYDMHEGTRKLLVKSQLEDPFIVGTWQANYDFWVPLRGFAYDEEASDVGVGQGRRVSVGGREYRRALGRSDRAFNPVITSYLDAANKVVRANKNEVARAFFNMVRRFPSPNYEILDGTQITRVFNSTTGQVEYQPMNPLVEKFKGNELFEVKYQGETKYVWVKDPLLLRALMGLGRDRLSDNSLIRGFQNLGRNVNGFLSGVLTRWNPAWFVYNFPRDVQSGLINLSAEGSKADGLLRGRLIGTEAAKELGNIAGGLPIQRGLLRHLRNKPGTTPEEVAMDRMVADFFRYGGATGWVRFRTVEQELSRLEAMANRSLSGKMLAKNLFDVTIGALEMFNDVLENSTRFAAFKAAVDAGLAKQDAANLVKNMTVNFNKKGESSDALSSLYVFWNAAVQGSRQFFRTMSSRRAAKIVGALAGAHAAMTIMNILLMDMDDEDWEDVPDHIKSMTLPIYKGDGKFFTLPLPYAYSVFSYTATRLTELAMGRTTWDKASSGIMGKLTNDFVPLMIPDGEFALVRAATPTPLRVFMDIAVNQNNFGNRIYNSQFFGDNSPDSSVSKMSTPKAFKEAASTLNSMTGGSEYRSGFIDMHPETIKYFFEFVGGGVSRTTFQAMEFVSKPEDAASMPILSRLVRELGKDRAAVSAYYENRQEILQFQDEYDSLRNQARIDYKKEHQFQLSMAAEYERTDKRLRDLRKRQRLYMENKTWTPEQREAKLEEVEADMAKAYMDWYQKFKAARREERER